MEDYIATVPDELLDAVFHSVVREVTELSNATWMEDNGSAGNKCGEQFLFRCTTVTHLRLACHRWNNIILSDPWFWTQMTFIIPSTGHFPRPPPRLVEDWLDRSGSSPLDISIVFPPCFRSWTPNALPVIGKEEEMEKHFGNIMTEYPCPSSPTYQSLLHSYSTYHDTLRIMPLSCSKRALGRFHDKVSTVLMHGYFFYNVWPLLGQKLPRWRSLGLSCTLERAGTFLSILRSEALQLSKLAIQIQHDSNYFALCNFPHLGKALGRMPLLRQLCLVMKPPPKGLIYNASYGNIPDSVLGALTHLEVTHYISMPQLLHFMGKCEGATSIKIKDFGIQIDPSSPSHTSAFRLTNLNALILSTRLASLRLGDFFKYLDLPNLRLLSLTNSVADGKPPGSDLFITLPVINLRSLQMLQLNLQPTVFDLCNLLSDARIQSIPILEVFPLINQSGASRPTTEEVIVHEIKTISPSFSSFDKCFLVERIKGEPSLHVIGWVDEKVVGDLEDCLWGWGVESKIVTAYKQRYAQRF